MTEEKPHKSKKTQRKSEGNKPQNGPATQKPAPEQTDAAVEPAKKHSVGKTLRRAREEMKLSLEDISANINVRVTQLRSIEDDRIDQLPGMTYAVGFVRSYAEFVKLDAVEVVQRFKDEHAGEEAAKTELKIPPDISEDKLPSPMIIGVAALAVIFVFVIWSIFADGGSELETASNIPPAPVVGTSSGMPTLADIAPLPTGTVADASSVAGTVPSDMASAAATASSDTAPEAATTAPVTEPLTVAVKPTATVMVPPVVATTVVPAPRAPVINVKRGKSRVMLEANDKSWVQITDGSNKVIYKKVMNPGEQFFVPDQKGMTLVTSNAGGLNVFVDGSKVQRIGRPGEILRGVELEPGELQKKRIRVRD
jgi:cytoskeleton protein RodZ